MEETMRLAIVALAGLVGSALLVPTANAVPSAGQALPEIRNIVPVAEGCGWGWHWVGGYRRSDGVWIPGHCARNN
jgi:hypothetical protein